MTSCFAYAAMLWAHMEILCLQAPPMCMHGSLQTPGTVAPHPDFQLIGLFKYTRSSAYHLFPQNGRFWGWH